MKRARAVPSPSDGAVGLNLHDQIANSLGIRIVSGAIPEGALLPTEKEAIDGLKVSRTPYREAIRKLVGKGLVSSRPNSGTRVSPRRSWALLDPEVLGWMFAGEPSVQAMKSLFELRMIVEPEAAALAAQRRTTEQLSLMGHALEEMAEHGFNTSRGQIADGQFHAAILQASDNEFLMALTQSITTSVRWTTFLKWAATKRPRTALHLHRELFSAVVAQEPERARSVTRVLLTEAMEDSEAALAKYG